MSKSKLQLLQDSLAAAKATSQEAFYVLNVASKSSSTTLTLVKAKYMDDDSYSQEKLEKKIIKGLYRHSMSVDPADDSKQVISPNTIGFIKFLNESIANGEAIDLNLNPVAKEGKIINWVNPVRQELTVDDLASKSFDL